MRITNGMMIDSFITNMQTNMEKTEKYTSQLSSNRRITRLSDDPVGVLNALTARQRLSRYEQYQTNLNTASTWVNQCETSLMELSSKMTSFLENLTSAASDINNEVDKKNISVLLNEYKQSAMETLNVTVGDQYVFAGFNTSNAPLTTDASGKVLYNGLDLTDTSPANLAKIADEQAQIVQVEVGYSLQMDVTMPAIDIMGVGDKNMFSVIDKMIGLLESGGDVADQLSACIGDLQDVHSNVLACTVRSGAMQTKIDMLDTRYSQDIINYSTIRSNVEDIDSAETIMDWKMSEAVYKQSLAVGAQVIMPTLMDFLS